MRVLVLLEHGRGLARWQRRHAEGAVYDATPYDYGSAASDDVTITFSQDGPDGGAYGFVRKGVLKVTGIDLVHVLRNLRAARKADVIWTHTETEHLGLGLLKRLRLPLPPVIAQSVWLVDEWGRLPAWRRLLATRSMEANEQLTTLSPVNADLLEDLVGKPVRFVPYGVVTEPWSAVPDEVVPPRVEGEPLRVLALGNDRHRDWDSLREVARAAGGDLEVRILTRTVPVAFAEGVAGLTVGQARSVTETAQNFAWADVVCLPLRANLHASGITVLLEAAAWSKPCVVTDTGGLDAYFTEDEVRFVPLGAPADAWLDALRGLRGADEASATVEAMRARVRRDGYSGPAFAALHVAMSRALLSAS